MELGLCALRHVEEEIKQEQDLATILLQRLVELSVLELLRHPRNAIQIHAQVCSKYRSDALPISWSTTGGFMGWDEMG